MTAVAPLVAEAERALHEVGWGTRVPRRAAPREDLSLADRRRLRHDSYDEVERAAVVIHVPAPANLSGHKLHRELQHALDRGVPVALLVALSDRERLGMRAPDAARLRALVSVTRGIVIESVAGMASVLAPLRRRTP